MYYEINFKDGIARAHILFFNIYIFIAELGHLLVLCQKELFFLV